MEILSPKMMSGYANHPAVSLYPYLWQSLMGFWSPGMGQTGNYLQDWSGRSTLPGSNGQLNVPFLSQGATCNITGLQAAATINITAISGGTQNKVEVTSVNGGTPAAINITAISAGTAATVNITAVSGAITAVALVTGGTGYVVGQVVPVSGGGGSSGSITVTAVSGTAISSLVLNNPGSGYTTTSGATLAQSGSISTISSTIPTAGTNYAANETVLFNPYFGTGATVNITASNGVITACTLNGGGAGYAVGQVYNICQNNGIGATLTVSAVNFSSNNAVVTFTYTGGTSGYVTASSVPISPIYPTNMSAYITVNTISGGGITTCTLSSGGSAGYFVNSACPMQASGSINTVRMNPALATPTQYVVGQSFTLTQGSIASATVSIAIVGSGCTLSLVTSSGTIQNTSTITNAGSGYIVGQTISVIESGGSNGAITVSAINSSGGITSYTIANAGSGYSNGTAATQGGITSGLTVSGSGSNYTLTGVANNQNAATTPTSGPISTITFGTGGMGYVMNQMVNIIQGNSSTATATITGIGTLSTGVASAIAFTANATNCWYYVQNGLSVTNAGMISSITINNGGTGYVTGQVLQIAGSNGNFGPALVAVSAVNAVGTITSLTLNSNNEGSGYSVQNGVALTTGMIGGLTINTAGSGYSPNQLLQLIQSGVTNPATALVSSVTSTGGLAGVLLQNAGSGYSGASVNITSLSQSATANILAVSSGATCSISTVNSQGGITAATVYTAGNGYQVGQYLNISQSGGANGILKVATLGGTAAIFNITAVSGGQISTMTMASGGSGYVAGQVLYILQNGSNNSAYITVNTVSGSAIATWTLTYAGSSGAGYTVANGVSSTGPGNIATVTVYNAGTGYTAASNLSVTSGIITMAVINAGGTGYSVNQIVPINQSTGGGACVKVTSVSSGAITGFILIVGGGGYTVATGVSLSSTVVAGLSINNAGTGYSANQYLQVFPSITAQGATINVYTSGGQVIWATLVTSGSGYTQGQILTIPGGTCDAQVVVGSVTNGMITSLYLASPGTSGYANATGVAPLNGAVVQVTSVGTGGSITGLSIISGNQGYVVVNNLSLPFPMGFGVTTMFPTMGTFTGGPGSAILNITASNGVVQATPSIVNGGYGYVSGQILPILQNGLATNAYIKVTGTSTVGTFTGIISSISLISGGTGYYSSTSVAIAVQPPVWSQQGRDGHCLFFPSGQSASWPGVTVGQTTNNFPSVTNGFSFSCQFMTNDQTDVLQFLLMTSAGSGNNVGCLSIAYNPATNQFICSGVYNSSAEWDFTANANILSATTASICNGAWHTLAVVCDAPSLTTTIYLDAIPLGSTTGSVFYSLGAGNPILIGGVGSNFPGSNWYCGDIGLWNRSLTVAEINQLHEKYSPLQPQNSSVPTTFNAHPQPIATVPAQASASGSGWYTISSYGTNGLGSLGGNSLAGAPHDSWYLYDLGAGNAMIGQYWITANMTGSGSYPDICFGVYLEASLDNVNYTILDNYWFKGPAGCTITTSGGSITGTPSIGYGPMGNGVLGGSGLSVGTVLTIWNGTTNNATLTVTGVSAQGCVTSWSVSNAGSGYTNGSYWAVPPTVDYFPGPYSWPAPPQYANGYAAAYVLRPLSTTIPYRYWRVHTPVGQSATENGNNYLNCQWTIYSGGLTVTTAIVMGTYMKSRSATYRAAAMTISSSLPASTRFAGKLFNATPFTIGTSLQPPTAGKVVMFNPTALTIHSTLNGITTKRDYKYQASAQSIKSILNTYNLGGNNVTFPTLAVISATQILNVGTKVYAVTNTNPAKLMVCDISTPGSPVWTNYTLTGAAFAQAMAYNSYTGILFVACGNGKVVEVTVSNPSSFTVYSSGSISNCTSIANLGVIQETYIGTDNSTGEAIALIESSVVPLSTDIHWSKTSVATIGSYVNTCNGAFVGMDMRFRITVTDSVACDVRFLQTNYDSVSLNPIKQTDFHVFVNGTELTDVTLDSIEIAHTADEKSVATFVLARQHDNVDYTMAGVHSQITGQQPVTIIIGGATNSDGTWASGGNQEFGFDTPAYVWDIDTKSETETVKVTCYSELPKQDERSTVNLSIPGINDQLHVYHALIHNPVIDNPYIMADDINPPFYLGILIDSGYTTIQRVTQLQGMFGAGLTEEKKVNYVLGSGDSGVYDVNGNSLYFKPVQNWSYFWFGLATNFLTGASWTGLAENGSSFIGSSPSALTSNAWNVTFIDWWYQRQFPDTVTKGVGGDWADVYPSDYIGVIPLSASVDSTLRNHAAMRYQGTDIMNLKYAIAKAQNPYAQNPSNPNQFTQGDISQYGTGFVPSQWTTDAIDVIDIKFGLHWGSAPYKKVSCKNGVLTPVARWEEKSDGLYLHTPEGYNYTNYMNAIGAIEYKKIQNINGSVLPKTKCDVEMFLDGYYHFSIQLLKRLNIDNTVAKGIYDSNNGFPVSVKSIKISAKDMRVSLNCSNAWSRLELLEMESTKPDSSSYIIREKWQFLTPKFDPNSLTNTV